MVYWLDNPVELLNINTTSNNTTDEAFNKITRVLIIGLLICLLLDQITLVYILLLVLALSVVAYHLLVDPFEPSLKIDKQNCTVSSKFNLDKQQTQFLQPDIIVPFSAVKKELNDPHADMKPVTKKCNHNTIKSNTNKQYYTKMPYEAPTPQSVCSEPVGFNADDIEIPEACKITVTPDMFMDNTVGSDFKMTNRIFDTEMNRSIPNNQTEAAKWIFGTPPTCHEEQGECFRYEDLRYTQHLSQ